MNEELQSGVCGGAWSINQSKNLFCSSPCASTTTDGPGNFGWTAHEHPKTPSDDSTGSIVFVDHDHDSWNQSLIMDDLQQNYSSMDNNYYAQNSFEFNPSSYGYNSSSSAASLLQTFFNPDSQTDHHQQQQPVVVDDKPTNYLPCSEFTSPSKHYTNHLFSNNTTFWNATTPNFLPQSMPHSKPNLNMKKNNQESKKGSSEASSKRSRMEAPSPLPTFKVRKEKLGDRVTALQQLVSPFGKTDTASVLHEAIEYIKFLHDQVGVLSTPYLKNGSTQRAGEKTKKETLHDLKSLGLCLVPISSTFPVAAETSADFWAPTFGGCFR